MGDNLDIVLLCPSLLLGECGVFCLFKNYIFLLDFQFIIFRDCKRSD